MLTGSNSQDLVLVSNVGEIRRNIDTFAAGVPGDPDLARSLFTRTTFWVFDPDSGRFGPNKFVGLSGITYSLFNLFRQKQSQDDKHPPRFNGTTTQERLERILQGKWSPDPELAVRLVDFAESLCGVGVLGRKRMDQWLFLSLPSEVRGGQQLEAEFEALGKKIGEGLPVEVQATIVKQVLGQAEKFAPPPELIRPPRVYSRAEVCSTPCPVPKLPGVYAWYFASIPPDVPTEGCHRVGDLTLLYVGIAPKKPSADAKPQTRTLYDRIRGDHYNGNAEGSTLRLTLGCLLSDSLGIQLRRMKHSKEGRVMGKHRMTFTKPGEDALNAWMAENAFVVWFPTPEWWLVEAAMIRNIPLPLNVHENAHHGFQRVLKDKRDEARQRARLLPVV